MWCRLDVELGSDHDLSNTVLQHSEHAYRFHRYRHYHGCTDYCDAYPNGMKLPAMKEV